MPKLIVNGDSIRYLVNGNVGKNSIRSNPTRGKILFQSEGTVEFVIWRRGR